MEKNKKRYNWKARKVVDTVIDNSSTNQINLELKVEGHYDQSNALVLPSTKRKTKIKNQKAEVTRILSNKQRKRLEKIVDKKKKKLNRADLLAQLQQVQATSEELAQLTSIASIQTKGLKRHFLEQSNPEKVKKKIVVDVQKKPVKLNSIKGAAKMRRKRLGEEANVPPKKFKSSDPNIVGFTSSESDTSSDDEENEKSKDADIVANEKNVDNKKDTTKDVILEIAKPEIIEIKDNTKVPISTDRKPAIYVDVIRNEDIQAARLKLPILAEEQQIMEVINENSIVIIAGETGSGKTTQVPQFLYEAGYALKKQIGVTEPRRVAAISMSQRVATELNLSSREVSYLIRFEGNVSEDTKIKFMTDGVLLKEIQSDMSLRKYSVIIIDEAHERAVNTDVLIGFLSRIVKYRQKKGDPLKLIIMSATLRLADFTENTNLFNKPPPVIKVEGRQFPVTVHFNKRTNENYLLEAYRKTVKIHNKEPAGGILVFVTGQQEVNYLVKKLRKAFPMKHKNKMLKKEKDINEHAEANNSEDDEFTDNCIKKKSRKRKKKVKIIPEINLDDYSIDNDSEGLSDEDYQSDFSDEDLINEDTVYHNAQPLWTLPLYSMLSSDRQQKIFQPPPNGCRLCVISTNIAETSLTIPNIKYVIDTGKTKVKLFDKVTGLSSYVVHWTSKASADQRAGRAGRLGPGHCFRLYSSAIFNDEFEQFSIPEIQQKPVDDLYLKMRSMKIKKVVNFPFPTPPDLTQLEAAERRLEVLGALEKGELTELGKSIAMFPVMPCYGKMLALSDHYGLLPYTICLVAALSVPEVLLEKIIVHSESEANEHKGIRDKWLSLRKEWANSGNSLLLGDNGVLLKAVLAAERANAEGKLHEFCDKYGLRHKAVIEIRKLRLQLTSETKKNFPVLDLVVDPKLEPLSDDKANLLRQIILCGLNNQIARKVPFEEVKHREDKIKFKYAYRIHNMEEPVFIHHTSVLRSEFPEFVVYQELYKTNKVFMRGLTAVDSKWLPKFCPALCNMSEPLAEPSPYYNEETGKVHCFVTGTISSHAWPLPQVDIPYPEGLANFKWFAQLFLEGKLFKKLSKYADHLLNRPSTMNKTWARLQPRTEMLLKALLAKRVNSKKMLLEAWKQNPKYLLREYLNWLPESAHGEVTLFWPPLEKLK